MPVFFAAAAVSLAAPKVTWNRIIGQPITSVEKLVGHPASSTVNPYTAYDPRWIKWIDERDRANNVTGHVLDLTWRWPDNVLGDADLWEKKNFATPQIKGTWLAYLGAPLATFEKRFGAATDVERGIMMDVKSETRKYTLAGFGAAEVEAYYHFPAAPTVTHITVNLPKGTTFDAAMKKIGVNLKGWQEIDKDDDPNVDRQFRVPLGTAVYRSSAYSYGGGKLTVEYMGKKGEERAVAFRFESPKLKDLASSAALFAYWIKPSAVANVRGTQSAWDRPRYAAIFVENAKQLTISVRNFDPNYPN